MAVSINPSDIKDLAPMPASLAQIAAMAGDEKSSISDIAKLIEFDEALTANLLKLVNSVWGKAISPILTVKDAAVRLGAGQILKLAVGQHVAGPMAKAYPGYELNAHELWQHSVAAALAAEHLSIRLIDPIPKLVFTAALLHDVGKLVLNRYLSKEDISKIRAWMKEEGLTYIAGEHRLLGTDHAEVGGMVARHWKFPDQLIQAIELHHDPDQEPNALLDIVHLSNTVAKLIGVGLGSEEMNLSVSNGAPLRLGIVEEDLEAICADVKTELREAEKMFFKDQSADGEDQP